ncbi:MAG: carboxymuconolactone decarboxylase family protein [Acetobacteraceae bacterium]
MTQRLDYSTVAAAGMKALGGVHVYVSQSGLPTLLVDLVYLRVSQINGCAYCIDMHSRDLIKGGMDDRETGAGAGLARGWAPILRAGARGLEMGGNGDARGRDRRARCRLPRRGHAFQRKGTRRT